MTLWKPIVRLYDSKKNIMIVCITNQLKIIEHNIYCYNLTSICLIGYVSIHPFAFLYLELFFCHCRLYLVQFQQILA